VLDDSLRRCTAVARAVRRCQQVVDRELRYELLRLRRCQLARLDPERVLQLETGAEGRHVVVVVEQKEIAILPERDRVAHLLELG